MNTLSLSLKHEGQLKDFNLRLNVLSQLKLKRETGTEGMDLIFKAMDDLSTMLKVFSESLGFPENENPITTGVEFYELLVDNGYNGREDFATLLFNIASHSGMVKEEQAEKLTHTITKMYNDVYLSIGNIQDSEKVTNTSEDAPSFRYSEEENPDNRSVN